MTKRKLIHNLRAMQRIMAEMQVFCSERLPSDHEPPTKKPNEMTDWPRLYDLTPVASPHDDPDPWAPRVWDWAAKPHQRPPADGNDLLSVGADRGPQHQRVYPREILIHAFGFDPDTWTHTQAIRVTMILRRAGWRKRKEGYRADGGTRREYFIPPMA